MSRYLRIISRTVRAACGATGKPWPIEIIPGKAPPALVGESWHYTTRSGRYIRFPSAYSRRGRSNMVYVSSSRRIIVGALWCAKHDGIA